MTSQSIDLHEPPTKLEIRNGGEARACARVQSHPAAIPPYNTTNT